MVQGRGIGNGATLDLQVKSSLTVSSSENTDFPKVVRQMVEVVRSGRVRVGVDRYGIAVRRKTATLAALGDLADRARANTSSAAFHAVHDALNAAEVAALDAVTSIIRALDDVLDTDEMVWQVLGSGMVVLQLAPDEDAGTDRALLNSWIGCRVSDLTRRARIVTELYHLSSWHDRHGGSVSRAGLETKLLALGHRLTDDATAPLVLTIQSMNPVRVDEVLAAVASSNADHLSVSVSDLVENRVLTDPVTAVERLTSPDGAVAASIRAQEGRALILAGSAHIPLAATVGYMVGNRGTVGVLDWHPNADDQSWSWPNHDDVVFPDLCVEDSGGEAGRVVVRLSLSFWAGPKGPNADLDEAMRAVVGHADRVVHLYHPSLLEGFGELQGRSVRSRRQSLAYATSFRQVMNSAVGARRVDVFYAGPLSVAFEIGRSVQETFHSPTTVWNYVDRRYPWGVELNPRDQNGPLLLPRAVLRGGAPPESPASGATFGDGGGALQ